MFGRKKRNWGFELSSLQSDLDRAQRHHQAVSNECKRLRDFIAERDELLALLLKLEPGLEKYRFTSEDDSLEVTRQWDTEGMKAAAEFAKGRGLAAKYVDTDRAVSPERITNPIRTKKEGTK